MTGKQWAVVVTVWVFVSACSVGSKSTAKSGPTSIPISQKGCKSPINANPSLEKPGCNAVSTMMPGREFDTSANFFYFKACGRPCWLPLYPNPVLVKGTAVTEGLPCEYLVAKSDSGFCESLESQDADPVHVICQVRSENNSGLRGDSNLTDDAGNHSNIWDKVYVPKDAVLRGGAKLEQSPDKAGYFAWGADLWLQNTGWHNIPCK